MCGEHELALAAATAPSLSRDYKCVRLLLRQREQRVSAASRLTSVPSSPSEKSWKCLGFSLKNFKERESQTYDVNVILCEQWILEVVLHRGLGLLLLLIFNPARHLQHKDYRCKIKHRYYNLIIVAFCQPCISLTVRDLHPPLQPWRTRGMAKRDLASESSSSVRGPGEGLTDFGFYLSSDSIFEQNI